VGGVRENFKEIWPGISQWEQMIMVREVDTAPLIGVPMGG